MNGQEIKETQVRYNLQSWSKQRGINPIPIEKADGIYMWDYDGNRYSDMSSQLVNLNVGHNCRPILCKASRRGTRCKAPIHSLGRGSRRAVRGLYAPHYDDFRTEQRRSFSLRTRIFKR